MSNRQLETLSIIVILLTMPFWFQLALLSAIWIVTAVTQSPLLLFLGITALAAGLFMAYSNRRNSTPKEIQHFVDGMHKKDHE